MQGIPAADVMPCNAKLVQRLFEFASLTFASVFLDFYDTRLSLIKIVSSITCGDKT